MAEDALLRTSEDSFSSEPADDPLVFVRFFADRKYIEHLREICAFVVGARCGGIEVAQRTRVVVHEVVENAVKYADRSRCRELSLQICSNGGNMTISVSSVPEPNHLARLKAELNHLYSRDAKAAYVEAFRRAASMTVGSPRIGLARVRYEGDVDLSVIEEDGGRIRVTATGKL